jgi:thiamine pyrophosphokinase
MPYNLPLADYKSILCLNSDLPNALFFKAPIPIIAADGAANQLAAIGIKPSVIIGDLDSIVITDHSDSKIIKIDDQNTTDFQKALSYIANNNLLPTLVLGVGGRLFDHVLNNINIIIQNNCTFYAPPIIGYTLTGPTVLNLDLTINTKISLFGIPQARVKTTGLKWELANQILQFPGVNSSLNSGKTNH